MYRRKELKQKNKKNQKNKKKLRSKFKDKNIQSYFWKKKEVKSKIIIKMNKSLIYKLIHQHVLFQYIKKKY